MAGKFVKGISGNPGGRSKEKPFLNALRAVLNEDRNRDKLREIANVLVETALKGEQWAVNMVADRTDGKALQIIDATVNDERTVGELATNELLGKLNSALERIGELETGLKPHQIGDRGTGEGEIISSDICKLN